jgi:TPR repeat protein
LRKIERKAGSADEQEAWREYDYGDATAALRKFLDLAQAGNPRYLVVAARMYIEGVGTSIDIPAARDLLDQAVQLGSGEAYLQRSLLLDLEGREDSALSDLLEAARRGFGPARYYLARKLFARAASQGDLGLGNELMQRSADDGYLAAQIFLARRSLRSGPGVLARLSGFVRLLRAASVHLYLSITDPHHESLR